MRVRHRCALTTIAWRTDSRALPLRNRVIRFDLHTAACATRREFANPPCAASRPACLDKAHPTTRARYAARSRALRATVVPAWRGERDNRLVFSLVARTDCRVPGKVNGNQE